MADKTRLAQMQEVRSHTKTECKSKEKNMIPAKEIDGELWVKASDYDQAVSRAVAAERAAIYDLVMEAPFKEFDRQEEDFDGEAANAMKAMAFSLTAAIRARSEK